MIFPTQGLILHLLSLLNWQAVSLLLHQSGSLTSGLHSYKPINNGKCHKSNAFITPNLPNIVAQPQFSSVQFSCSVVSDSLRPHELQHARRPCPSPTPRVYSNPYPSSWWCHPTISSSVLPFSCPQSFPASGTFPMSQLFASGGQSIGVSALASVLSVNTQDSSLISLQSKGPSRVFSNTTVQKH